LTMQLPSMGRDLSPSCTPPRWKKRFSESLCTQHYSEKHHGMPDK
jgi:hypothetical protein